MNWKTWAPLAVAAVLGLGAAKLAGNLLSQRNAPAGSMTARQVVVVAKTDLAPGQTLSPGDLGVESVAATAVPEGAFTEPVALVGRVVIAPTTRGRAIVAPLLAPEGSGGGLQVLVPAGQRAITIEVNEFSGLAGMLTPGCRVDVIATLNGEHETMARTIVQNVKVTAVGQRLASRDKSDEPSPPARSVTLLVNPQEAEAVQLACSSGRPWLALRGRQDEEAVSSAGVSLAQLRGTPRPTPMVPPSQAVVPVSLPATCPATRPTAAPPHIVSLIRGGQETRVTLKAATPAAESSVTVNPQSVVGAIEP